MLRAVAFVVVGILLLLAGLLLGWLAVRRVRLMRGGGVDLCLRRRFGVSDWHFGVGRYQGDEFAWFRLTSLRFGPSLLIDRAELQIVNRREPLRSESFAIPYAVAVLHCRARGADVELAMAADVLTGFLSWLEAGPPGRRTGYRQAP